MNKTIIFHHIPKTAGSTFINILKDAYESDKVFTVDGLNPRSSIHNFEIKTEIEKNGYSLISGHLADHIDRRLKTPTSKILFLRNPVEHTISSYYYIKRATWNKEHKEVSKMNRIESFLETRSKQRLDNLQLRHVIGATDFLLTNEPSEIELDYSHLEKGYQVLEETDYVLIMEKFDISVLLLYFKLGWNKLPYYRLINKTKGRPSSKKFSDKQINLICETNKFDMLLYKRAVAIFEERYASEITRPFLRQVRKFNLLNRVWNFFPESIYIKSIVVKK